jgi:hypothetical protein
MTNEHAQDGQSSRIDAIDEARYLLASYPPKSVSLREPTAEEVGDFLIDMLRSFAEVELSDVQRAEAHKVLRALPSDDATLERFIEGCEQNPLLTPLASVLRPRLATPHTLLSDPKDGFQAG